MFELSLIRLPFELDLCHMSAGRTFVAPGHDLLNLLLLALEQGLDTSIGKISDPASHTDANGFVPGACTEVNTLDQTLYDDASAKMFSFSDLHS